MATVPFSVEQLSAIEVEFEEWHEFLNFGLGVFSFNAALACLGLKSPHLYAWLALLFFFVAGAVGARRFPPSYKWLRDKQPRTKDEEVWLAYLSGKFLGTRAMFRNFPLYWVGVSTLACVALKVFTNV